MDPGTPVTPLVLGEYRFNLLQQREISFFSFVWHLPLPKRVVVTALRHPQHATKDADRKLVFVGVNKGAFQVACLAK